MLPSTFKDLDKPDTYGAIKQALTDIDTTNFAVEFDGSNAYAASDLDAASLERFLNMSTPSSKVVKWINIFGPERQTDCIKAIAKRYGLSPRLTKLLASPNHLVRDPIRPNIARLKPATTLRGTEGTAHTFNPSKDPKSKDADIEKASSATVEEAIPHEEYDREDMEEKQEKLNHYNIANNVWHYWSIDWSGQSVCIGFNSLSNLAVHTPSENDNDRRSRNVRSRTSTWRRRQASVDSRGMLSKPDATRLWTWLLRCEDGTIISIQENPFPTCDPKSEKSPPEQAKMSDPRQQRLLKHSRQNLVNVFRHLSKAGTGEELAIDTLDIRPGCSSHGASTVDIVDSSGLLFYYLFDDWYTAFTLVADDRYRYAVMLESLRRSMFDKAQLEKIEQLHEAGRQLAVLKRVYESYVLLIDRILSRQGPMSTRSTIGPGSSQPILRNHTNASGEGDLSQDESQTLQMPLTPKASVRFERLRDRIRMYALSEMEECLEEKESLVFLNFNLMTMRQSQAVEKLTRITILLAKVTIMFMPDVYTAKTYWICFAVTIFISFLFLLAFGMISHTLEGGLVYKSVTEASLALPGQVLRSSMRTLGRQSKG